MSKVRRSFTPAFNQEAVDLLRRSKKSQTQVARELGIGQTTLSRWAVQADRMPLGAGGFLTTEELKVLRREVERLRQERDILKKAPSLPRSRHEISVHSGEEGALSGPGPVSGVGGGAQWLLREVRPSAERARAAE
jgi:transposase